MTPFSAKAVLTAEVTALLAGRSGSLVNGEIIAGDGAIITLQDPTTGEALLDYASAGAGLIAEATN
ncbi:MAG: aldehyde dehydrogenase, partial [Alphaproteobacteria bacterium]